MTTHWTGWISLRGGAEVVRGALTSTGTGYLEAPEGSVAMAAAVITSACQGSPLAELWDDGDGPEWRESFTELSERLQAALR
jgi:hypothetical protein